MLHRRWNPRNPIPTPTPTPKQVLHRQMDFFSRNLGEADRVHRVQGEIDEVRSVM